LRKSSYNKFDNLNQAWYQRLTPGNNARRSAAQTGLDYVQFWILYCNLYEKFVPYIGERGEYLERMSNVSSDPNYTDSTQSGIEAKAERAGDLRGEPPTNKATSRETASKMANLLEGLQFPANKEDIKNHINRKSPAMGNRINDVFEAVQNNLEDGVSYNSVYDIELAAGLVERKTRK
jgi:hypothetical protein